MLVLVQGGPQKSEATLFDSWHL